MNSLEKYIENVKSETEGFSDIEKLRYVYCDLGKRFQFDLDFSFGNTKNKMNIYNQSQCIEKLNESLQNNIVTCKSISNIYKRIMRELGVNIRIGIDEIYGRKFPHVYNIVTTADNNSFRFDLQEDMRFIKAHLRTRNFGISMKDANKTIISRFDLDQIDKKIGYVTGDLYYTDEYLDLIKMDMELFDDLGEKIQFVLENSEAYTESNMGYADRKWRMEDLIGSGNKAGRLFSMEEKRKIKLIDCYKEINGVRRYELCIVAELKGKTDIYLFSERTNSFEKKTINEFAELTQNGLVNMQGINGLKQAIRKLKLIINDDGR